MKTRILILLIILSNLLVWIEGNKFSLPFPLIALAKLLEGDVFGVLYYIALIMCLVTLLIRNRPRLVLRILIPSLTTIASVIGYVLCVSEFNVLLFVSAIIWLGLNGTLVSFLISSLKK